MQKFVSVLKIALLVSIGIILFAIVMNMFFGSTASMFQMMLPLAGGLFAYWFLTKANLVSAQCPRCATQQPTLRKPTSLRQMMWGGWTCANCGTEIDRKGQALNGPTSAR